MDVDRIDDADDIAASTGLSFMRGRHPRRAAADDEDRLADSGVDRVDGHQIRALGLAARIHRPRDHQLVADEPRISSRRDHGPNDFREEHRLGFRARSLADRQRLLEVGVRPAE